MFDIFKELLNYMPRYLSEFVRLLSGPRTHIGGRINHDPDTAWHESLFFVAISFTIIFLLRWAADEETREIQRIIVADGLLKILEYAVAGLIVLVLWRMFGVRDDATELLTVFAYWLGVVILLDGLVYLVSMGGMKLMDPDFHRMTIDFGKASSLADAEAVLAQQGSAFLAPKDPSMHQVTYNFIVFMSAFGAIVSLIWTLFCWGTYRSQFAIGWGRILAVIVLFMIANMFNPMEHLGFFASRAWS